MYKIKNSNPVFFSLLLLQFFLSACATKPTAYQAEKKQGFWETKTLVRDFKQQKTTSLSIDFVAIHRERLRAEVTGPFGIAVATLVLNGEQFQMALHTQKKFYSGLISEKTLTTMAGVPLDPRILYNVLFDEVPTQKGFTCLTDAGTSLPLECKNANGDIKIVWSERQGELKRILIAKPEAEIQILVKSFTTKVQDSQDLYKIKAPDSYRTYQLDESQR